MEEEVNFLVEEVSGEDVESVEGVEEDESSLKAKADVEDAESDGGGS